jgi:DNA repair protein RecN (Recombination protein N)
VTEREEVRRKADYLRHVVEEVTRAAPQLGEAEALDAEANPLAHADELGRLARELEQALDTSGLARAAKLVAGLERLDPAVKPWQELLDGAFANAEELAQAARDYTARIEGNPGRLATVEQRRDLLFRLMQKYGPAVADVLATRDQAARELELLDTAELDLRAIADQEAAARADFTRACAALSVKRRQGADRLERAVNALLPALGLRGQLAVRLQPRAAASAQGAEDVSFDVELNVGLEARPLAKVASGGELSRIMLALKVVLAEHDRVPALVFDEVDQGIGGEVGGRVGEALAAVAHGAGRGGGGGGGRQALVITHLPQIAVHADHHLVVAKAAPGGVATSDVQVVRGETRTRELARMLGDADMATALRHAAELLKKASATSAPRSDTPSQPARPPRR